MTDHIRPLLILPCIAMGAIGSDIHARQSRTVPNVLICIADDAGHMSAYGTPWVSTPNFDRVASDGLLFRNAFTCNSKSAPSRACLITGRNSWQLREACNHWPEFPADIKSYPEVLAEKGYHVGYTGKGWGPGIAKTADGKKRRLTGKEWNKIRTEPPTPDISPIDYAANFEAYLKAWDGESPLCFWYGSKEPHRGYEYGSSARFGKEPSQIDTVPSYWPDNDVVRTDMLDYAVEIEHYDRHLGRILHLLDSIGELDNTIVIATSDHGMPFPRCKGQEYYHSCHVPLAVMWKAGMVNPGRVIDEYVSLTDMAPTIMESAGIDAISEGMLPMSGRSIMNIIRDRDNGDDREYMLLGKERHDVGRPDDQGYPIRGLIRGDYLYIRNYETDRWPAGDPSTGYMNVDGSPTKTEIIRSRHDPATMRFWQLSMGKRPAEELYDLRHDPECVVNIAGKEEFAGLKAAMEREMTDRLKAEGDPRMSGQGEVFDRYPNMCKSQMYWNRVRAGETVPHPWINDSDFDPDAELIAE